MAICPHCRGEVSFLHQWRKESRAGQLNKKGYFSCDKCGGNFRLVKGSQILIGIILLAYVFAGILALNGNFFTIALSDFIIVILRIVWLLGTAGIFAICWTNIADTEKM